MSCLRAVGYLILCGPSVCLKTVITFFSSSCGLLVSLVSGHLKRVQESGFVCDTIFIATSN
jgi:hypothetical protein